MGSNDKGRSGASLIAIKKYPKSLLWTSIFYISIISCGYGTVVTPAFYSTTYFVNRFGVMDNNRMDIEARWKFALIVGAAGGQAIGAVLSGWPSEKWGRKKVMFACNSGIILLVGMQLLSNSLGALCATNILLGCIWGATITQSVTYASEISPLELRAILTAFSNMAFVIGQLIANGLAAIFESRTDHWSYKGPLAFQWLFCMALLIGIPLAPESPWYLVRTGKFEKAKESLRKLSWNALNDLDIVVENILKTDLMERESQKSSSYSACFKGINLRRTEICVISYASQILCGAPLPYFAVYFLQVSGIDPAEAFLMGVGNMAVGLAAYSITFVALCYFGRRSIFCSGLWFMTIILLTIGILDCVPNQSQNKGYAWAEAGLLAV